MGRIVYIPRVKKHDYPEVDAGGYPAGSVWESDDGSRWLSVWDSAKKEYVWTEGELMSQMREVSKMLAGRDRDEKIALISRRRAAGLKQEEIDLALGWPRGWTHTLESYDSDPTMSDMSRYEAIITVAESNPEIFKED